jgi:hypothetical protein
VGEVLYLKKGDCHVKYLYLPFIMGGSFVVVARSKYHAPAPVI